MMLRPVPRMRAPHAAMGHLHAISCFGHQAGSLAAQPSGKGGGPRTLRRACTQEMFVPRRRTGTIIGPGGETAAGIRRAARCQLHVCKDVRPDDTQSVEVSGTLQQVGRVCAGRPMRRARSRMHAAPCAARPAHSTAARPPLPPAAAAVVAAAALHQVRAGVERVREVLLAEDRDIVIHIAPDASTYVDVLPEMVGYVLGTRCAFLHIFTHTIIFVFFHLLAGLAGWCSGASGEGAGRGQAPAQQRRRAPWPDRSVRSGVRAGARP